MKKAVYAGTFDPITLGHLDVIERSAKIFDFLYIGVAARVKKNTLIPVEERHILVSKSVKHISNVKVLIFNGLLVDFVKECQASVIVRGLRALSDFEYEFEMASANKKLMENVETMFLPTSLEYSFLSSSLVKEVASLGGDISIWVPNCVSRYLKKIYKDVEKYGQYSENN